MAIRRCIPLLGTYVEIEVDGAFHEDELLDVSSAVIDEISRIQVLMSYHDPESELSKINRLRAGGELGISRDMLKVLEFALDLGERTAGKFDVTMARHLVARGILPDLEFPVKEGASWRDIRLEGDLLRVDSELAIDLGGIAKGYAVDCAQKVCDPEMSVVINAGGDLTMSEWEGKSAAIRVPGSEGRLVSIPMRASALATSAAYFSTDGMNPIVNPSDGKPAGGDTSYSVFAGSCMIADALTKVAFLVDDCSSIFSHYGATALQLDAGGNIIREI
ncbi:FAD:protein FMN transferase [Luteolibacter sp. AS25]|uniref:FAD:protein FMN transferase n=1 Tax=Luteolibacter sp. AS25 TaxID=3135776 RepID=UPI00398B8351